jgi:hypothetical protein
MAATVIGVFDTIEEANRARDRMIDEGIPVGAVRVGAGAGAAEAAGAHATTTSPHEEEHGFFAWLRSLFGSDDDEYVGRTAEATRRGSCVVAVEAADDRQQEIAERVMQAYGAIDVDQRAERWRQEGWAGYNPEAAPLAGEALERERKLNAEARIPVVQEDLEVGKREVVGGRVRVVTLVVERPVERLVMLTSEHARVERHAVDRPATEADLGALSEGTIEVTERTEVPVVAKTARVVEEVAVG